MKKTTALFLNIRKNFILIMLLVAVHPAFGQTGTPSSNNESSKERQFGVDVGVYFPMAFGNNFVSNGMKTPAGGQVSFTYTIFSTRILIGLQIAAYVSKVDNSQYTGNYEKAEVSFINAFVGYIWKLSEKYDFQFMIGGGSITYGNIMEDYTFYDNGVAFYLKPKFNYYFQDGLGIFLSAAYRRDFMNMEVPEVANDRFNNINSITVSAGIRFRF